MRITTKGQVTIPQETRNRLALLPHTQVELELAGNHARIRKARLPGGGTGPMTPGPGGASGHGRYAHEHGRDSGAHAGRKPP